jgi:hypothetical protein
MRRAIFWGFLRPKAGYELPDEFGLYTDAPNGIVREALADYISAAVALAPTIGLMNFQQRLAAFQDCSVVTENGTTYDEFFGVQSPSLYDLDGKWLGPS